MLESSIFVAFKKYTIFIVYFLNHHFTYLLTGLAFEKQHIEFDDPVTVCTFDFQKSLPTKILRI